MRSHRRDRAAVSPLVSALAAGLIVAACASNATLVPGGGVNVGEASALRNLVPAQQLNEAADKQYGELLAKAQQAGLLAQPTDRQVKRLRAIHARLLPNVGRFNAASPQWGWQVNLIKSDQINAFCMPGGKIAFYSGILDKLKLTDDEVAVVMGHEIAHALREHGREQIAKNGLTQVGSEAAAAVIGGTAGALVKQGAGLLSLKFSRDDETDADLVGLELTARGGYDPRAGVSLWKKMAAASGGAPMEWMSTHPSSTTRIAEIERNLPAVLPLYEEAKRSAKTGNARRNPPSGPAAVPAPKV
ncbi:MAG: M48 family metallopeptidase [Hyphomicrobiaceae bacterium]|nr:M48 family metallopeptidase [Hyphomicrobiaceae bacterium]